METVFKPTSKEKCTMRQSFPKYWIFLFFPSFPLRNWLHQPWTITLSKHQPWTITLSKTTTMTLFLCIYRISAAIRDEVLGKTTVDEQCQKFILHKIHLNICIQYFFWGSLNLCCAIYTHKSVWKGEIQKGDSTWPFTSFAQCFTESQTHRIHYVGTDFWDHQVQPMN